jgi:DNA-binding transcriptional ArsR family regulator
MATNRLAASASTLEGLAALADPTRDAIVRLLADGERSVGEIAEQLPVSRPAVSKHLRLLQGAGLVRHRSEGTRNVYALEPDALAALRDELDGLWRHALARFALVAGNNPRQVRRSMKR